MHVFVQIPCKDEAETLPLVLQSIPKRIAGVDKIDILIIDDGCQDQTVAVAKAHGVTHFVRHTRTMGLGRAFHDGVNYALAHGADIVVNTDGDNQYPQDRMGDLVQPILKGQADIVIADRQTHTIEHFSAGKKFLQKFGSRIVNIVAGTDLPDTASGFRAYSKEAIIQLNTVTRFSYCMETIIQAGNKRLAIQSIPVVTNAKTRESRLFKSTTEHVIKSAVTIIRAYVMYRPYVVFATCSALFLVLGLVPFIRYLVLALFQRHPGEHLQSLITGAVLIIISVLTLLMCVIADLIRINRVLAEDSLEHIKRIRYIPNNKHD